MAVVVATEDIRLKGFNQKQPIFQYVAGKDVINVGGNYNLPYYQGKLVAIRYNQKETANFKIDTTWEKWKDIIYWGSPFFLIVTMIFLAKDIIPRQVTFDWKLK